MRLLGVDISGYRRFLEATIDFDSDPVAVIGRNEAGKSSLLEALTRLSDDQPIARSDQTRGHSFAPNHRLLTAWFALDDDDRAAIKSITEAATASVYQITKSIDGTIRGGFHPYIPRDSRPRQRAHTVHQRVSTTRWYAASEIAKDNFDRVGSLLASTAETLSADQIAEIEALAAELPSEPEKSVPAAFKRQLAKVVSHERTTTPTRRAARILIDRRPPFVLFEQRHRDMQAVYDLTVSAGDPPPVLANVASLAGLSLSEALRAHTENDYGRLERLVRDANARLQTFFSTAWRQSSMHVQLRIDKNELRILVDNLRGDLTDIGERSAGLQTFVALVAFLSRADYSRPPVVLIDEAETHLHYDAQADLIRVLSEQDAAAKVIYTTHSAGCLPLDLGLGVRAVTPLANDVSSIENSIWELGPGLSPILLAMGASVLAFSRARRAVVGEGASEAILLPTLLKEAVAPAEVNYQVAPGLADATREAIDELELEAVSVAYILDSDKGGRAHAKRLVEAGIPETRMAFVGGSPTAGLTLEDLVSKDVYRTAVNESLATWHPGNILPANAVPEVGRAGALAVWCRRHKFEPPDKKRVAARLLALRAAERNREGTRRRLTTAATRTVLRRLHADIRRMLDVPRQSSAEVQ